MRSPRQQINETTLNSYCLGIVKDQRCRELGSMPEGLNQFRESVS